MLEAKAYLLIEPILPREFYKKVRYITDLSPDVVICDQKELFRALNREFQISTYITSDINDHLGSGMSLIVDLEKKDFKRWDEEDSVLIRKGIIRDPLNKVKGTEGLAKNKKIEDIVNNQIRKL